MILDVTCVVALSRRTGRTYTEHAHQRLDLRFDTRDTAVVYLHMSLRRARAPEKFVEWVRAKFALSQKKKW